MQAKITNLVAARQHMKGQARPEMVVKPSELEVISEEEAFLQRVLEAVDGEMGDSTFDVGRLADRVGLSRRQFERRLRSVTGLTPAEMIRQMRLERASQLLRAHAGTVSEIAYAVGFTSPSHFSTAFKEAYGETPSTHAALAVG